MKSCLNCPGSSCAEHCDNYLRILQELLEAEALIEELRHEIACLEQNASDED